jgi:hypothetical protein
MELLLDLEAFSADTHGVSSKRFIGTRDRTIVVIVVVVVASCELRDALCSFVMMTPFSAQKKK